VTLRSHDIGIRMALGADRDRILGSVLAQACTMAIVGVLIGAAFAAAGIRVIHGLLYGIAVQGAGELENSRSRPLL
jgi:ABC-type antimicrobial peptide transport system permease subunit